MTLARYITGLAIANVDPVLNPSPADPLNSPNFTDSDLIGWLRMGSYTTLDANTTYANHLYIKSWSSSTDDVQGIYRPWAPTAGSMFTVKIASHTIAKQFQEVGIFAAEATPGRISAFNVYGEAASPIPNGFSYHWRDWSSPSTQVNDLDSTTKTVHREFGPFWLRIRWNSDISLDFLYSHDGFRFETVFAAHAPTSAFTTGSAGIYVLNEGASPSTTEGIFANWTLT